MCIRDSLSRMYKQNKEIKNQIDTARRQQEEFSIITENMQEGLVVIDRYTMILSGNSSVWKLFHVNGPKNGESVYVLNRSEEFQSIIDKALDGKHNEAVSVSYTHLLKQNILILPEA